MAFDRPQVIGGFATALTVGSCFCHDPRVLRRVQAGAAVVWMAYGIAAVAPPPSARPRCTAPGRGARWARA